MAFISIDQVVSKFAWEVVEKAERDGYVEVLHSRCRSFGTELRIQHLSRALAQLYSELRKESTCGAATCLFNAIDEWRKLRRISAAELQPQGNTIPPLLWQASKVSITQYGVLMEESLMLIETLKQYSSRPSQKKQ